MTRNRKILVALGLGLALLAGGAGYAYAQGSDPAVQSAIAGGAVGEQADGYLGFPKPPSAALQSKVEAINIKRRAAYTDLAAKRGVSVKEAAAATGCQILQRLGDGQAYQLPGSGWATKSGAIALPAYCG